MTRRGFFLKLLAAPVAVVAAAQVDPKMSIERFCRLAHAHKQLGTEQLFVRAFFFNEPVSGIRITGCRWDNKVYGQ